MSKTNNLVFNLVRIVTWIIFIGLCIDAGGLIVNFIFSLYRPELVHNLYQKLDLSQMYAYSKWTYFSTYSSILIVSILKSYLFYLVVDLVTKINLSKPFSSFVSKQITKISYFTLSIGLVSYIAKTIINNVMHSNFKTDNLNHFWADSEAFILMSAVIYVIAIIFQKGIEIQNENDLTV